VAADVRCNPPITTEEYSEIYDENGFLMMVDAQDKYRALHPSSPASELSSIPNPNSHLLTYQTA
jgi:hypothetical protein